MRQRRTGRRAVVAVAATAVLALSACAAPATMPAPTPTYSPSYTAPPPIVLAPLTGEEVDAAAVAGPSLAAKVDNHVAARPQVGLEHTDLVFEELVEGGITRYVAVWHSDIPEEIGPVRSIRPMDPEILSPFRGIVAYSGGQYRFVQMMLDTPVLNAIHGQPDTADLMYRTSDKWAPHNVIVRAQALVERHAELDPPAQQFAFATDVESSTAAREGAATGGVTVRFSPASTPSWTWDAAGAAWLRSQRGEPDVDSDGDRLTADNVVILQVPVTYRYGLPKTELVGSGTAWVLSGGSWVSASWSKSGPTAPIRLSDGTGTTVRLAPGNTWIELMPSTGGVEFASSPAE